MEFIINQLIPKYLTVIFSFIETGFKSRLEKLLKSFIEVIPNLLKLLTTNCLKNLHQFSTVLLSF